MESIQVLDKKCIIGCLRKRDLDFYGVGPKELDGIVEQLRLTVEWKWLCLFMKQRHRNLK